jgi:hypothetical protein
MKSELKRIEIETFIARDDDFPVEHALVGQLRFQWIDELREISIERLFVAALYENFFAVAENECAESVPLRLEDPSFAGWELADSFCEHREKGRIYSEVHNGPALIHERYQPLPRAHELPIRRTDCCQQRALFDCNAITVHCERPRGHQQRRRPAAKGNSDSGIH